MSGGYFDGAQYRITDIASDIEELIRNNDSDEKDEFGDYMGRHYPPEIIIKFKDAVRLLRLAHIYAHRIDWLVCGDDGEESFIERLKEELAEFNA